MASTSSVNQTSWIDVAISALSSDSCPLAAAWPSALCRTSETGTTGFVKTSDMTLTTAFEPLGASDFLNFDSTSYVLPGSPPGNTSRSTDQIPARNRDYGLSKGIASPIRCTGKQLNDDLWGTYADVVEWTSLLVPS